VNHLGLAGGAGFTLRPHSGRGAVTRASSVLHVSSPLVVADCPTCRCRGTVVLGANPVCMACFAEFREEDETISHGGTEVTSLS
jgi:hypothetical protein